MKVLISLALVATAIPAGAQIAQSAGPGAAGPPAHELRDRVTHLTTEARAHARRLGLAPAARAAIPDDPGALARRAGRLENVVSFLSSRREVRRAVDERALPPVDAGGRGLDAGVRRAYQRAARLAVARGVSRPAPLRMPAGHAGKVREIARWRAVADWLSARAERVRRDERPLRLRVPHYEAFMCIARHESHATWDIDTGNGYYGGLQMDRQFQQTYAPGLYRTKGTADHWTPEEQIRAAGRAVAERGFTPWPNTARMCGLL